MPSASWNAWPPTSKRLQRVLQFQLGHLLVAGSSWGEERNVHPPVRVVNTGSEATGGQHHDTRRLDILIEPSTTVSSCPKP
jgi:hypothetical protein